MRERERTQPPGRRRAATCAALLVLVALAAGCASQDFEQPVEFVPPETTLSYEPEITGAPSEEVAELMRASLLVFRRQEDGAQSLAFLRRRAEGDIPTAEKILRSYGYYAPKVTTRVTPAPPAEATDPEAEPDFARVEIVIEPGPPFILQTHNFRLSGFEPGEPPAVGPAEAYGSPIGRPAEAEAIVGAENRVVAEMLRTGRPYARNTGRDAVVDPELATMEVETMIDTGRAFRFGPVSVAGAPNVSDDYILTYLPWREGEPVSTAQLSEFQRDLMATGLFRSGRVTLPEEPPAGEVAPVTVTLEEAPFRTVSAGLRYDTSDGPATRLRFEHRNVFGANEIFGATLDAGLQNQRLLLDFRKPQYLRPGQDLVSAFEARHIEEDAYDEIGGTLTAGLQRELNERWTVGAGGLIEVSEITDNRVTSNAYLFGLPAFAAYDGSNDLLNPTTGERFRIDVTPFTGVYLEENTNFLTIDTRASIYRPLDDASRYVVAARTRLGSIISEDLDEIPPTRRLYSGGAGSVRGYQTDFVGPLDDRNDPIGGRSVLELSAEFRARVWEDIGVVVFSDAGSVSDEMFPDFDDGLQYAVGAGVRYYSPVGPIRVDFAVPLDRRDADDAFQFYIAIGQAF